MTKNYPEITKDISAHLKQLKAHVPEVLQGTHALSQASFKDGTLPKKTKELIALAIGVAARCDGCIGFHTKTLVELGTTPQELAEMLGVAIFMGGGPSLMTAAEVWKAYTQFKANPLTGD